ncbi:MAG: thioesterase-like protein, partial [Acidiferrobacteraceae bacterium]|nr:thioesterase-like protein [Acidiferrobacteraceae bacterium]
MTASFETAELDLGTQAVLESWIDYNGHMNVAYYVMAFD